MAKVTKTTWNIFLRISILASAYGYMGWKLWKLPTGAFSSLLGSTSTLLNHGSIWIPATAVFLMMFLNWGLETLKWQKLISKIERIPFLKAYIAIFTGITASVFTPNRVGEYIGRVFVLESREPAKGILITLTGSLAQILIYLSGGATASLFLFYDYILPWRPQLSFLSWFLIPAFIFTLSGSILIFTNLPYLVKLAKKMLPRKWHRIRSWLSVLQLYNRTEMLLILLISLLRYLVFTFQYIILLKVYGLNLSLAAMLIGISVIIMLLVVVPSFALSELGVRNSVALFVFELMLPLGMKNDALVNVSIIAAASTLWLINVALPAIIGSFFVFKLKFFDVNGKKA